MNWIRRNQGWGKRRGEVASIHPAHRGKSFKEGLGGKDAGGGFSKVPCKKSRLDASRTTGLGEKASTTNSGSDAIARQLKHRAHMPADPGKPGGLLPVVAGTAAA